MYNKTLVLKEIAQELRFTGFCVAEQPGFLLVGLHRNVNMLEVETAIQEHAFCGDVNITQIDMEVKITAK